LHSSLFPLWPSPCLTLLLTQLEAQAALEDQVVLAVTEVQEETVETVAMEAMEEMAAGK
jgi:hypothetical protein